MERYDRLPLLVRFLLVGVFIAGVRAIVAGSRAYLAWLPDAPLGIILFAASGVLAFMVIAGIVRGIVTGTFAQAYREGRRGPANEAVRRELLERLATDLHQLRVARSLRPSSSRSEGV
jgi:hypothetical protein